MKSKKRSGRKSDSRTQPEVVFFLDRSLGRHTVATVLRGVGASVEVHDDHLEQAATDTEWMDLVASRGWIALTKDDRIRYRPLERERLLEAGIRVFILGAGSMTAAEMAQAFQSALPAMKRMAERPGPWIARVSRDGKTQLLPS